MKYVDEVMDYFDNKDSPDVKDFLYRILSKWKIFVICGGLGICLAYLVSKYSTPVYMMRSSLLVHVDPDETSAKQMFEGYQLRDKANIQNHVEILKSFTINRKAMEGLEWNQSWYKKTLFVDKGLYRNEPFEVIQHDGTNLTGIPVFIRQIDSHTYKIKVDGETEFNGEEVKINFEKEGFFNQAFKNKYFNFTLKTKQAKVNQEANFYFVFNDLDKLTLKYMESMVITVAEKKAELIHLRIDDSEPARGVDFLNELNWEYLQFRLIEKNKKSENTVRFIDSRLEGIVDSLQLAGQSFTNFRSRNRIVDLGQEASVVVAKMEELESQLSQAEISLEYYKNLLKNLDDANQMKQVVAPSVAGITDPTLDALVTKLTDLYGKREVLSYSVQAKNPSLVILNKEIDVIRQSLDENLKSMVANSQIEVASLSERMTKVRDQLARMPKNEQKFNNMKRNFDLNNELYTFLLKKRAEAAIAKASNVSDAQIIDPARLATIIKIKPKLAINLLIGMLLGLGFPFLIIILQEFFNDNIQSREELVKKTKLPILGTIAHNRYANNLPVFHQPRSAISESFRSLRTNLNYVLPDQQTRIIGVHSTIPAEGKSFATVNLASIVAMNNKKVLLIGADMRKPKIEKMFDLENKVGLSTYLIRYNKWQEVVQNTHIKNLYCVTSGPVPPNPAELLENGRLEMFLNAIRGKFDYVFIDNAPISMVTDGFITGKLADANLFVLRQGYSHKEQINFVNQIAERGTLHNVSLVLNDVNTNGTYSNYANGDGYYYEEPTPGIVRRLWEKVSNN
ncbi:GumC family protein [Marinifilum caeruleilacunae]|uniref:non-specific protein-tyrosine kinase n=1 Tax=Marinifilum caeruleilacunae TaxID=2499076 RepID=A0ABX1WT50_9BACT|nr:tyrosine-protein kinase [Marinifilum caeruleilacunae]NOU59290.1 polysaccharide biosynthesis tyrosine autokinase [Marinifilum caeruleilacunae]